MTTVTGLMHFTYDKSDQPVGMDGQAPNTRNYVDVAYLYDGNMKRVKSVVNGKIIYNVYDLSGRLVHIEDGGDETDYLHGMGQTLARIKNGTFTYLHPDHLGSPQVGTTEAGSVSFTEHYTPYGEALLSPAANDNQSGITGHIKDKATGLNYMQARYYDPNIGRFLSVDPVTFLQNGNPAQFNRYVYAWNDPINGFDPDGRETRLMIEAHHLDMEVVNGNMTFAERNEISRAQFDGMVTGLSTIAGGGVGGALAKQHALKVISGASNQVKGKMGEIIVRGKLALKGQRLVTKPQTRVSEIPGLGHVTGRGANSVADFPVRGKNGVTKIIDAKFTTTGKVSNTPAQRHLKGQIGDNFSNAVVHADDVATAAGRAGAAAGGTAGGVIGSGACRGSRIGNGGSGSIC